MIKLNFYSKILKTITEWQNKNEYVEQISQLIYYNEICRECVLKFKKFIFSEEDLDKIKIEVDKELLQKYSSEIIDELNDITDPLQKDLEKRKMIDNSENISLNLSNIPIEEINNIRKIKIQQYAINNKEKYETTDIYMKFEEEDGNIVFEIVSEDILSDIATIDL